MENLCKGGRVMEAQNFFDQMVRTGVKPTVVSFTILIDAYCLDGNMDEAIEQLTGMDSIGVMYGATYARRQKESRK
jgi:pentatricopeptide repeat protein